jgi:hypothetical protein
MEICMAEAYARASSSSLNIVRRPNVPIAKEALSIERGQPQIPFHCYSSPQFPNA